MNINCRNCDGDLVAVSVEGYRTTRIDIQFCSDKCKSDYHNELRKARRKVAMVEKSLQELDLIYQNRQENPDFKFISDVLKKFLQ